MNSLRHKCKCVACGFLFNMTDKLVQYHKGKKNKELRINLTYLLSQLGAQTAFPVVFPSMSVLNKVSHLEY